jgi:hypothetical protein
MDTENETPGSRGTLRFAVLSAIVVVIVCFLTGVIVIT